MKQWLPTKFSNFHSLEILASGFHLHTDLQITHDPLVPFFHILEVCKWLLRTGFEAFYVCLDGSEVNRQFV